MSTLFQDDDFPADSSSLFYDGRETDIEWSRPAEITSDPVFVSEGATRFDLCQGSLGNCWFLSAAATLTTRPELFNRVVPTQQSFSESYSGQFNFRFWRFGSWIDVTIDDRLPVRDGTLVFCKNRTSPNEYWAPLLEKAFAKLFGSYQAMDAGNSDEAFVDFTGGIGEYILLDDIGEAEGAFFRRMKKLHRKGALMSAVINPSDQSSYEARLDNGLVVGHAYSLTNVVEFIAGENAVQLVRLRNPWGYREWNGAWSDSSEEWATITDEMRETFDLTVRDDGEFWIPVDDMRANFHALHVCHLSPDSVRTGGGGRDWNVQTFHGSWIRGVSAGGCGASPNEDIYWINPQYFVRLTDPDEDDDDEFCTLVVSLMQKYARMQRVHLQSNSTEKPIGVDVYKYTGPAVNDLSTLVADQGSLELEHKTYNYQPLREVTSYYRLSPGVYCIIPCLFNPNTEGHFMLRTGTEREVDTGEAESISARLLVSEGARRTQRRFDRLFDQNVGTDQVIDHRELRSVLNEGFRIEDQDGEIFSRDTCRALILMATGNRRGRLDKGDCKLVWRKVKEFQETFSEFDSNETGQLNIRQLRNAFISLGFRLSRRALERVVDRYCGNSDTLSFDEFVLCAAKVTATSDQFENRRGSSVGASSVPMTLDDMLDIAL